MAEHSPDRRKFDPGPPPQFEQEGAGCAPARPHCDARFPPAFEAAPGRPEGGLPSGNKEGIWQGFPITTADQGRVAGDGVGTLIARPFDPRRMAA
jgi:hypothetical protein